MADAYGKKEEKGQSMLCPYRLDVLGLAIMRELRQLSTSQPMAGTRDM